MYDYDGHHNTVQVLKDKYSNSVLDKICYEKNRDQTNYLQSVQFYEGPSLSRVKEANYKANSLQDDWYQTAQ